MIMFAAAWHGTRAFISRGVSRILVCRNSGVSNVGVYAHPTTHGDVSLSRVHFGISQTVSAPCISVSAVTVEGQLCLTVQYATPIWPEAEAEAYVDGLVRALELAAAQAE